MDATVERRYGTDMTAKASTLVDLRKAGIVTSSEIVAAVDAYMRDPTSGPFRFSSGHVLDIAAAVAASPDAAGMLARPGPKEKTIRNAVAAIIMALPVFKP